MNVRDTATGTQMIMPGMRDRSSPQTVMGGWQLHPGVEVTYRGNIKGGPKFGATGVVPRGARQARRRRPVWLGHLAHSLLFPFNDSQGCIEKERHS